MRDESDTEQWKAVLDALLTAVEMHHEQWDDSGEALGANLFAAYLTNAVWNNTTCPDGTVQSTECPV